MGRVLIPLHLLNRLRKFPSKSCSISGLFEAKGAKSYGCILHVTFLCRSIVWKFHVRSTTILEFN